MTALFLENIEKNDKDIYPHFVGNIIDKMNFLEKSEIHHPEKENPVVLAIEENFKHVLMGHVQEYYLKIMKIGPQETELIDFLTSRWDISVRQMKENLLNAQKNCCQYCHLL